jgi:hypothetical protein
MSRFAFGLRYFLFGLGSALNTGEHVTWSIHLTQDRQLLRGDFFNTIIYQTDATCLTRNWA